MFIFLVLFTGSLLIQKCPPTPCPLFFSPPVYGYNEDALFLILNSNLHATISENVRDFLSGLFLISK